MANYSAGMKAAWAKKSPEERSARAKELAFKRWHNKNTMEEEKKVDEVAVPAEAPEEAETPAEEAAA